jgi:hypothetical protein
VVGFFYREEREGAQRGFMGLGINREVREGARRGRIFNRKGIRRDTKESGGTQRNAEGRKGMRRDAKECEETQRNVEGRKERILN